MNIYLGLLASVIGLGVASHIYRKKKSNTKLVCPRNGCEYVVHSTHATTLGIPNELMGLGYYIVIGLLYAGLLILPCMDTPLVHNLIRGITGAGVLFTLYLVGLQAFVIKHWCHWCLGSAFATLLLAIALFL